MIVPSDCHISQQHAWVMVPGEEVVGGINQYFQLFKTCHCDKNRAGREGYKYHAQTCGVQAIVVCCAMQISWAWNLCNIPSKTSLLWLKKSILHSILRIAKYPTFYLKTSHQVWRLDLASSHLKTMTSQTGYSSARSGTSTKTRLNGCGAALGNRHIVGRKKKVEWSNQLMKIIMRLIRLLLMYMRVEV